MTTNPPRYTKQQQIAIGQRLRQLRTDRGLSQSEVAKALGLKHSAGICGLETGKAYTQLMLNMQGLCELYRVTLEHLTTDLPAPKPAPVKVVITARDVMIKLTDLEQRMERLEVKLDRLIDLLEADGD